MDFSRPFRTVTPTLDGPILRALAGANQPMTRAQLTEIVGDASEAGVRKVLRRLAGQGIVIEQRIGSQYTYSANRDHIHWPAVDVLVSAAQLLDQRIKANVDAWEVAALSVEMFGSVASGTSDEDSDVDLMIYRPALSPGETDVWDQQVTDLKEAVERWTGNVCEVLELDPPGLIAMVANREPVLSSRRVPITGTSITAASPSREIAQSIQEAWTTMGAAEWMNQLAASAGRERTTSPELRRTLNELTKILHSSLPDPATEEGP